MLDKKFNVSTDGEEEVLKTSGEDKVIETSPSGFSTEKDRTPNKRKPLIKKNAITHNPKNAVKIEMQTNFNKPNLTVGFYTKHAVDLLTSQILKKKSKATQKMGLDSFDKKCRIVNNAIRDDNPFADSIIYDIENLIDIAHVEIKKATLSMEKETERFFISHDAGISYDQDYSCSCTAEWNNQISYKIMWLIKEVDTYFNQLSLASRAAIITEQTANSSRRVIKNRILNILHYINRYKHSNVTRTDIANMTANAKNYFEKQGNNLILQSSVLIMESRGKSAPRISVRPKNKLDAETLEKLTNVYQHLKNNEDQAFHSEVPPRVKTAF